MDEDKLTHGLMSSVCKSPILETNLPYSLVSDSDPELQVPELESKPAPV